MEIIKELAISKEDESFVDLHSFLNVLSALVSSCLLIEYDLESPDALKKNKSALQRLIQQLRKPSTFFSSLRSFETICTSFMADFDAYLQPYITPDNAAQREKDRSNIVSILNVAAVRSQEMLDRAQMDSDWQSIPVKDIESSFQQFFGAVEQNAKGRYRIIKNVAAQTSTDYLVHLVITGLDGERVHCPVSTVDVMRDLIANARKYTPLGGTIDAGLEETKAEVRFTVRDTGQGIPEGEIEKVVEFGYRASNAQHRTLGGGFGLTKAYQFVKKRGGRFWIDSGEGKGTSIRFTIPKPNSFGKMP